MGGYMIDTIDQIFQMIWLAMELSVWFFFAFMLIFFLKIAAGELIRMNHFYKHIENHKRRKENG